MWAGAGGVVPLPPAPSGAGDLRLRAWDTPSVRAAVRSLCLCRVSLRDSLACARDVRFTMKIEMIKCFLGFISLYMAHTTST